MAQFSPNTVTVEVYRATRVVASQSLSYPMLAVPHNLTAGVVDLFTDAPSIVSLGAATNSPLATMVQGCFAGRQKPQVVKVARMHLNSIKVTVPRVIAEANVLTLNACVNDEHSIVSYTVPNGVNTTNAIATNLAVAITTAFPTSDTSNPTVTVSGNVITVTPATNDPYGISFGYASMTDEPIPRPHLDIENVSSATPTNTIVAAMNVDSNFFFIGCESQDVTDVRAMAALAQTTDMVFLSSTDDIGVTDNTDNANIATDISGSQYSHTLLMYSSQAAHKHPECLVIGEWAAIRPYSLNSLNLRTLQGLLVDQLTPVQRQTLATRNCNFYFNENGMPQFFEGWMGDGDFADTVRFSLWSKLATRSAIASLLKQRSDIGSGVSYDDDGKGELEQRVWNDVVNLAIRGRTCATGWTTDPETGNRINLDPVVDFGTRAQQTNANIAARIWDNAQVEMVYISPIHHVNVKIYVILNRDPS